MFTSLLSLLQGLLPTAGSSFPVPALTDYPGDKEKLRHRGRIVTDLVGFCSQADSSQPSGLVPFSMA